MSLATFVAGIAVVIAVIFAFRKIIHDRKTGGPCGLSGCGGCPMSGNCTKEIRKK